ncbi:anaerobic glycerol-3-phosphate dehydrogenase subunit GlpA [Carboxydothermus ferrireducens]|uniref:glycerol-3-phosphate dehydrogenase n=1 Tax=Carboxydothermus ferrireducens DSM 11255 TaxID=1119529 RepID=A0ABX2RBP3_9THEO|nr:anaerobic glycerol-3-phosphate dehydrogenase subunit GlpA [Carboxydothermus ferrireducens]NYE58574.1 glycerol-3-phosphate dehydrogenase [Carboxydothermus ferrireducens DSM 11255]
MQKLKTTVLIIGGGATGTGLLRDLTLRGLDVLLVEQKDIAYGASSRFHGLLHSGARYAVKDPNAARECIEENLILKKIAPTCVEETGGYFIELNSDDPAYTEKWLDGCRTAGIEVRERDPELIKREYPFLTKEVKRVFEVPDGTVDGFRLCWANVWQAEEYGGRYLTYHQLVGFEKQQGRLTAAKLRSSLTGEEVFVEFELAVNAAGAWAAEVAKIAGVKVNLLQNKGTLIAFNQRIFQKVFNRLRPPSDGDIWVPHYTITILGTTSVNVDNPEMLRPTPEEITKLLEIGKELIPDVLELRILRAFAGIRPLYLGEESNSQDSRSISRDFVIIDHERNEGLKGLISLVGGKLTTYRLMAEKTGDYIGKLLGIDRKSKTSEIPLTPALAVEEKNKIARRYTVRAPKIEERLKGVTEEKQVLCECEGVTVAEVKEVARWEDTHNLEDLRRKTRLGMGTCQGLNCAYRGLGVAFTELLEKPQEPLEQLKDFLKNRYAGQKPLLWGEQLREAELLAGLYGCNFSLFGGTDDV